MNEERPKVGIGLLVIKGHKILLGKRRTDHGDGEYGGPGGHFEHLESIEGAMLRDWPKRRDLTSRSRASSYWL